MIERCLLPMLLAPALGAAVPREPAPFVLTQRWAGAESESLGFTRGQLQAFLSARSTNLRTAQAEPWSAWLKGLEKTRNPSLRAWALARRVEAGDYSAYPAFQEAITDHLLGISKPGSGRRDRIVSDPPHEHGLPMPDALRIDHGSVFWASLQKTLRTHPRRKLEAGMYSVWCYGTHPDQRELILEVAAHVESLAGLRNPAPDPWNDPRFWIVLDWAMAWGNRDDFAALRTALPDQASKTAFDRAASSVLDLPGFLPRPVETEAEVVPLDFLPPSAKTADPSAVRIDFSQVRVREQPMPPRFPREAQQRQLTTHLVLALVVGAEGTPLACRPLPGPWLGFFAPTGIAYGMRWRFHPAELDGKPQAALFRLTMPFRLRN